MSTNQLRNDIIVKKDKKMLELKQKYENNELCEKDLSEEEIKALIQMYEEEEKVLDEKLAIKKLHISEMLREMKTCV